MRPGTALAETGLGSSGIGANGFLPADALRRHVDEFLRVADNATWNRFEGLQWSRARPESLSPEQRSAVEFVTFIEDHIPNYFGEYNQNFPIDASVDSSTCQHNRILYHFTVRWSQEEDRHAHVLAEYQVRTGMVDRAELDAQLAVEGAKRFKPDVGTALELFTYTLVQEKATQLYYQQLAAVSPDPVLRDLLRYLARDEARHFAFFFHVVGEYVEQFGDECLEPMKRVATGFKMPLHDTLDRYWRRALVMRSAAGYDHTEAFESLRRVVERFADARTRSKAAGDLYRFVEGIRGR